MIESRDPWLDIKHSYYCKSKILVSILSSEKDGWNVCYNGIAGFLPKNQLNYYYKKNPDLCLGKIWPCLVTEFFEDNQQFVVSHKKWLDYQSHVKKCFESFFPKTKVSGIIKRINEYGVYLDINGFFTFVPSRALPPNYSQVYFVGNSAELYIDRVDLIQHKIFLCYQLRQNRAGITDRQHKENYKKKLEKLSSFKQGEIITGVVKAIIPIGVIICVKDFDGIVYNKNLTEKIVKDARKIVQVGQLIEVVVLNIDKTKAKLYLGVKQVAIIKKNKEKQRIKSIASKIEPGSILEAKVMSFSNKKVILELGDNIPGIILQEDLAGGRVPVRKKVFEGMLTLVVFLREDDGVMYFSTKLLEPEKYAKELFDLSTEDLLRKMGIKNNSFLGKATRSLNSDRMYFKYLYAYSEEDNGLLLCDPFSGSMINISVKPDCQKVFEEDKYYRICVDALSPDERKRKGCPYLFELGLDNLNDTNLITFPDPYKKLVEQTFMKQTSPSSNASLANLLEEVGQNMYDSKERMFFELLQNADDASAEKGVQVNIESVEGYLLLSHNGLPFNRKDFVSITSAARSTKRGSKKKTGYKGIGFKSVFTNSTRVIIKTGGFFFTFDKANPLFDDFDNYYLFVNDITDPQKQIEYLERFKDEKEEFKGVDSIPWQLLPEWTNQIPSTLENTIFNKKENVSIALAMSDAAKADYLHSIKNVLNEPKFMLFIRHTNRIHFKDGDFSFVLAKDRTGEKITLQSTLDNQERRLSYIVREAELITVSSENFKKCNIDIVVETRYNNKSQKEEKVFCNSNGEKIASIPSRIAETEDTLISYAFSIDDNGKYIPLNESTTLFAYLPMTETRYPFPFYINADFILKSSREGVQSDNPWNFFIFYNIGKEYVKWIGKAASIEQPNYLSLLLDQYFDEKTTGMTDLSSYFNRGYKESIHSEDFIINDLEEKVSMSQIVLDHTGLSSIIGSDNFCDLISCSPKRLPHHLINSEPLNKVIFDAIEHIADVTKELLDLKNKKYFRNWMQNAEDSEREAIYEWLIRRNNIELIKCLPLFKFNGKYRSFDETKTTSFLFIKANLLPVVSILKKLKFVCYDGDISKSKLYEPYLENNLLKGYDDTIIKSIIERSSMFYQLLSAEEKTKLYNTISTLCNKKTINDQVASWKLFCNIENTPCVLSSLMISSGNELEDSLFSTWIINNDELTVARNYIEDLLLPEKSFYIKFIYPNWSSILNKWIELGDELNWNDDDKIRIYDIVTKYYKAASEKASNKDDDSEMSIPTISSKGTEFILCDGGYKKKDEIYFHSQLSDKTLYDLCQKLLESELPLFGVIPKLSTAPFLVRNHQFLKKQLKEISLSSTEICKLIELCKSSNESLFENYIVINNNNTFILQKRNADEWLYYYKGASLQSFITDNCKKAYCLPSSFAAYKSDVGITTGKELFERVFNNVDCFQKMESLLPIVNSESVEIKELFVSSISSMSIAPEDFTTDSMITKFFVLLSEIVKDEEINTIRNKISIKHSDTKTIRLSDIRMQGVVTFDDLSFDLSILHPEEEKNDQKRAQAVLDAMRLVGIKQDFLNDLFGMNTTITADEVYSSLDKTSITLQNKDQLVFLLLYAKKKQKASASFKILNKQNFAIDITNTSLFIEQYSFVNDSAQLSNLYDGFLDLYKTSAQTPLPLGITLKTKGDVLSYIKPNLSEDEISSLLDFLYCNRLQEIGFDSQIDRIKNLLGINSETIVVSDDYSMQNEQMPSVVTKWVNNSSDKKSYIIKSFSLIDEKSAVVRIREYLTTGTTDTKLEYDSLNDNVQNKICSWIVSNNLTLDNRTYSKVRQFLDSIHLKDALDSDKLNKIAISLNPELTIQNFNIYKISEEIPRYAYLPLNNNYVVIYYKEGNNAIWGNKIFILSSEWHRLNKILQCIATDPSNSFTAENYLSYCGNQNTNTEEEALKNEIARLRKLLEDNNIDVSTSDDEYGGPSGDIMKAILQEARAKVIEYLEKEGFNVSEAYDDDWTRIDGVMDKDGNEYPIVVRSYRNNARNFVLNAGDWEQLMRSENSMLWIVTNSGCHCISFLDLVKNTRDRISFSFSTSNFDRKDRITALAEIMRYFRGIRFDFGSLIPSTITTIQKFNQPERELKELLIGDDSSLLPS